jgi:beta-lactamase regulating signal transducer with metallopeptidase domain
MILLLNTTIKISLIVLAALAATSGLRRRSAAVRHFVLAAALACAAATPAVRVIAPAWQSSAKWFPALTSSRLQLIDRPLAVLDGAAFTAVTAPSPVTAGAWNPSSVVRSLHVIWATGVAAVLIVLAVGIGRLSWIAARARRVTAGPWVDAAADLSLAYGLRRAPLILQSDSLGMLGTWGIVRSKVLLPADALHWPADRIRIVLAHELAHVRRRDWMVQVAAQFLCAVYWFNPLVWIASRRLRIESEQACDDVVLAMGVEGGTYASELVDLARAFNAERMFVPAAAIARPSSLERRVRAMLNVQLNRDPITRSASIAAALAVAAVTVAVAGFGVSAQAQFGSVSGSVADPKGRPLVGTTLTLSNAQSQSKYEIKSDVGGHFEFVGLPAGSYMLVYEHTGFATLKREGIVLTGQVFQSNAVMQVGSVEETIRIADSDAPRQPQAPITTAQRRTWAPKPNPCGNNGAGGCIVPPTKVRDVRPIYPTGVKPGSVQLSAVIGADGHVATVDIVGDGSGGAPDPSLANSAASAISQWEFTPTYLDGEPIDVRMKVNVSFISGKQ